MAVIGRSGAVLALTFLSLLANATAASAHAVLESSVPDANAVVAVSPPTISLTFSSPVAFTAQLPQLFDPHQQKVSIPKPTLQAGGTRIEIQPPHLGRGTYTVTYRVESTDGHSIRGVRIFSVGAPSGGDHSHLLDHGSTSRAVGIYVGVLRAVAFGAFTIAVGSVLFVAICGAWLAGSRRAQMLSGVALFVLGVAAIAQCFAIHAFTSGGSFGDITSFAHFRSALHTDHGKELTIRFGLCLVGILVFARHRLRTHRAAGLTMVWAWAIALAATFSLNGHPRSGRWQNLAMGLDTAHIIAASAWIGGLVALVFVALTNTEVEHHGGAAKRFSKVAFIAVVVVASTGSLQAVRQLAAISDLWSSTYGRLLIAKVVVIAMILAFANHSRKLTLAENVDGKKLRSMVAVETIGAAIVISLTALLVNAPPPQDLKAAATTPATRSFDTTIVSHGYTFAIQLNPASSGSTMLMIQVLDDHHSPAKLDKLEVTMRPTSGAIDPLTIDFTQKGSMYMSKSLVIPSPGAWTIAIRALPDPFSSFTFSTTAMLQ